VSAAQAVCADKKIPWDRANFFSLHGRELILPWVNILNSELAVIYCDHKNTASEIAYHLVSKYPKAADRVAVLAENIGAENEQIVEARLEDLAECKCGGLSILVILPESPEIKIIGPGVAFGRDDSEFVHENRLITHSEIRAVALSKLMLGPGVMWDMGAGSGSVGVEVNLLCPTMDIYSVEIGPERCEMINLNAAKFGVNNIHVINDNALEQIGKLPSPRSVFIGGGGKDVADILKGCYERLLPGGRIVASAVLLETRTALASTLIEHCDEVLSISISRSKEIAGSRMMKSENTIELFVYSKPDLLKDRPDLIL
jgi:precorrin-6B C5,15-methyltransferase / cobalt-precorrin-6B C5,C15-methyltransferase